MSRCRILKRFRPEEKLLKQGERELQFLGVGKGHFRDEYCLTDMLTYPFKLVRALLIGWGGFAASIRYHMGDLYHMGFGIDDFTIGQGDGDGDFCWETSLGISSSSDCFRLRLAVWLFRGFLKSQMANLRDQ